MSSRVVSVAVEVESAPYERTMELRLWSPGQCLALAPPNSRDFVSHGQQSVARERRIRDSPELALGPAKRHGST